MYLEVSPLLHRWVLQGKAPGVGEKVREHVAGDADDYHLACERYLGLYVLSRSMDIKECLVVCDGEASSFLIVCYVACLEVLVGEACLVERVSRVVTDIAGVDHADVSLPSKSRNKSD